MQFHLDRAALNLSNGAVLNIHRAKGRSLRVLAGRVWITQEGSLDDLFLEANESCTFASAGSAIVTAEGAANAAATVLFDAPLTAHSRGWRLFG